MRPHRRHCHKCSLLRAYWRHFLNNTDFSGVVGATPSFALCPQVSDVTVSNRLSSQALSSQALLEPLLRWHCLFGPYLLRPNRSHSFN